MSTQTPFKAYHSAADATVNGEAVLGWIMYDAKEVDPLFSEMLEALETARLVLLQDPHNESARTEALLRAGNAIAKARGEK